jgi:cytidine deaminase
VLAEFGLDTLVLIGNDKGELLKETSVRELLPEAFTPADLAK